KDLTPRVGGAYDLFGNGKTAIKGSIGRYVGGIGTEFAVSNHPEGLIVTSATRTWNDANTNFTPDCDLNDLNANGECGPISNRLFGQPFRSTFYDQSITEGWNTRPYSWQGSLSLQHELRPGASVNIGYFWTQYANFSVNQNQLVTPADFTTFCLTGPSDARLP